MATPSTKTYLQIVNDAIDEAGAELASFAADGSDWDTNTDPMMNRFKKWVNKAWRDLQVEANDWHWLDETAVVNINPGIMFYSDFPITDATANINPLQIIDTDGTVVVSNLKTTRLMDLTGSYTSSRPFGYFDIQYNDYNPSQIGPMHVLDFGLKSGGERLVKENNGKVTFLASFSSAEAVNIASFLNAGDVVNHIVIEDVTMTTSTTHTFTNCQINSCSIADGFVVLSISYSTVSTDPFAKFIEIAQASVTDFKVKFSLNISTNNGTKTISGSFWYDDMGNQYLLTGAITPINYKLNVTAPTLIGTPISIGTQLTRFACFTPKGAGYRNVFSKFDAVVNQLYSDNTSTSGIFDISVMSETGLSSYTYAGNTKEPPTCWTLWTGLLFAKAPVCNSSFTGLMAATEEAFDADGGVKDTSYSAIITMYSGVPKATLEFTYNQPYLSKNFIHSWKSFNWNEENDVDDFVESIRQTNNSTYRIISHDDPAVAREAPLIFVPWDSFQNKYDFASSPPSTPRIITEDNTGRFRLYPAPDRPYTIMFDYIREPQELVEYTDVPKGLPRAYEDMIMWLAVRSYGEYDEQPSVVARANKRYKDLLLTLQQEYRPVFHFKPRRLY